MAIEPRCMKRLLLPTTIRSAPTAAAWPRMVAAAGPAANLAIVLVSWAAIRVGVASGLFYAPSSVRFGEIVASDAGGVWPALALVLGVLFSLNLLLAVFNMIPVPPLDGGNVLLGVLPDSSARMVEQVRPYGILILYALMLTGALNAILGPLVGYARYLLGV